MKVHDIMTTDIITVNRDDDLRMVDDIMAAGHIRHVPVVEDNRLIGVVSQRELFSARVASTMEIGENAQRSFLHTFVVNDVMSQPVITISPDASVSEAAVRIMDRGIGCLPVVKGSVLEGIVTKTDLLRCLRAVQEAPERTSVE